MRVETQPNPIHNNVRVNRWFSRKRVKIAMDFETKESVEREERWVQIYGSNDKKEGKEKELEQGKYGVGVKKEEIHTNWNLGRRMENLGKVLRK